MTYLPQIRILVPSAQVSSYTTGSFNLPSAKSAFVGTIGLLVDDSTYQRLSLDSGGNSTDFGDTTTTRSYPAFLSSSTRAVAAGGYQGTQKTIEYVTIATAGNGTSFGNLVNTKYFAYGTGSSTRGIISGGYPNTAYEYITIATTGNATGFGNATAGEKEALGGYCSTTRSIDFGGSSGSHDNTMRYITIATTGSGESFGNLTNATRYTSGSGSSTRGIRMAGRITASPEAGNNVMDYATIASLGNATDFGDLATARLYTASFSSATKAFCLGGAGASAVSTTAIEYVVIATTGNSSSWGDLHVVAYGAGTSNAHGGL